MGCSCNQTPCNCNPGCGPGQNWNCPPSAPQLMFFQGLAGQPGPLAVYAGAYNAATIYYLNNAVSSVVLSAGSYWRTANAQKNATNTWGTPMNGSADWVSIGSAFSLFSGNSFAAYANAAGNTLITPTSPNHTAAVTFTGGASIRILILDITGQNAGNRLVVDCLLPVTPNIVLNFRNATAGGTQLLPVSAQLPNFPGNGLTTDGSYVLAALEFYFDGTQWNYLRANIPA